MVEAELGEERCVFGNDALALLFAAESSSGKPGRVRALLTMSSPLP